uniref:AAA family ATPase n=1 Tax=Roseihalotalea indica TaxID=2867963 RepID=A0AA49GJY6_9BACT|nr:AAA family ATPase [Tunicatimonas sp. TK19036]
MNTATEDSPIWPGSTLPAQYRFLSWEQPILNRNEDVSFWAKWLRSNAKNDAAMLLIKGEAGIGKTVFAHQLMLELRSDHCFCLYGKFHNTPSGTPYLALKQCLQNWLDQLLLLDDESFECLKANIKEAIKPYEHVLTSVFEELELLLGKNALVFSDIRNDPQKERLRFTHYFQSFLKAIHRSKMNIVFYLDDLQWADMATLNLLHQLLTNYELPGLIILGTYRPITKGQLQKKIQKIQLSKQVREFKLPTLNANELSQLIPSSWMLSPDEEKGLLKYLMHESKGKPFDALQILSLIVQEQLIMPASNHTFQICWDKLPQYQKDHNIIKLVIREFNTLTQESLYLLRIASCIGYYFSIRVLKKLSELDEPTFEHRLQELIQHKIIIKQEKTAYFVHDNYLSAIQAELSPADNSKIHHDIAIFLIAEGALDTAHPYFFNCINHLNLATPQQTQISNEVLGILNFTAALLARKKSAFDRCLSHLQIIDQLDLFSTKLNYAIELPDYIPQYTWLPSPLMHNSLCNLYWLGRAESEFLVQNYTEANHLLNQIIDHSVDGMLRLKAYTIKIKICIASLNDSGAPLLLKDGMRIIESLLIDYHITLPQNSEQYHIFIHQAYTELLASLPPTNLSFLEQRSLSEDQEFQEFIQLIVHSLPIIFFIDVEKSKYLALRCLILCFQQGFTPSTPALFASSVFTLSSISGSYSLADELGKISIRLVEKAPYSDNWHTVYHLLTLNCFNWRHHYRESAIKLDEAYQLSLERGDHNYAIICYTNARLLDLFRGIPLRQHPYYRDFSKAQLLNLNFASKGHAIFVKCMTGEEAGLLEDGFDFKLLLKPQHEDNLNEAYHFHFVEEQLYLYSGNYLKALEAGNFCEKHRILYEALPIGNEHDFYYCVTLCQIAERRGYMDGNARKLVESRLEDFKRLAAMRSGNYLHKQKIIQAELARIDHLGFDVITFYDEAIEEALNQKYIHLAALASERCGHYLVWINKPRLAESYLQNACVYYQRWNAYAKVEWLRKKYTNLCKDPAQSALKATSYDEKMLTWNSVQSAMDLSQELYTNDLIKKILTLCVEQTGAQRAHFLCKQQLGWQLAATLDQEGLKMVHQNLYLTTPALYPHKTIYESAKINKIQYVASIPSTTDFPDAEYFKYQSVNSFLVIPINHHQEALGIVYLENCTTELIESHQLLPWLELIRLQTGIALSNARLYENQLKLNQEIRKQEQKRLNAVVETQEKERKRVAAELHDNLGQMLALVKLNLSSLEDSLEGQFSRYLDTCQLLDESCNELRRIAHDMMPPDFDTQTIEQILEGFFRKYLLAAGLTYDFQAKEIPQQLSLAVKFNLYRMVQEIVHNIIKHAKAQKVSIELSNHEDQIYLKIMDDGAGFDAHFKTDGLGLRNLHNRVKMLNGRIDIDSGLAQGSTFHIHIPIL